MTPLEISACIDACPLFSRVESTARARLAAMARPVAKEQGEHFFFDGDPMPGIFIIQQGQVRVYKTSPSGKEYVLHLAEPSRTFGEAAVLGGFAAPACAEALMPTRCVLLPTQSFNRALAEDHALCLQLLSGMAHWVRGFVDQLEDLVLRDAKGRLARYLLQSQTEGDAELSFSVLKRHLASHLDLTSETLSRTLRRLEEEGLIRKTTRGVRILDRRGLGELA